MLDIYLLLFDTSNFWVANWYYVLAVLIALTSLIFGIKNYFKKNNTNKENSTLVQPSPIDNTNTNTLTVNFELPEFEKNRQPYFSPGISSDFEKLKQLKQSTQILFIDDDSKFQVVKILKNAGWINTKSVKDIKSLDDQLVKEADIFFVDIQGVGLALQFSEEGLGLALALKKKYPHKKIIIYSAETKGDRFHEALRKADSFLQKNAEPYEFQQLVEQFSQEL